jgi:hypothetical protein
MNYGINNLWPTKVLLKKIENEDVLNRLCQDIVTDVNFNHPPNDFDSFNILEKDGVYEEFKKTVVEPCFDEYLTTVFDQSLSNFPRSKFRGWLAGSNSGYSIPFHNHSGSTLSAVFYLMCENNESGGELVMVDPRFNANRGMMKEFKEEFSPEVFKPVSSTVIIFPSYLYHYTNVFKGSFRLAMPVDFYPGSL